MDNTTGQNQPPTLKEVELSSFGPPRVDQFFTCNIRSFSDPEGDTIRPNIAWTVDGQWFCCQDKTQDRVFVGSNRGFQKGDTIQCEVQLIDENGAKSDVVASNAVTLGITLSRHLLACALLLRIFN